MKKSFRLPFELVLVIVVLAANLYVVFAPPNSVMNWFTTDDAFYYFKTAQNFTQGLGLSFDGIGLSSGFHPLWMLICIPTFALARFDLILPLRIIVFISVLLAAGSSVFFYKLLNQVISKPGAMFISLFWAFEPRIQATVTQLGMEAGINAFFVILLFYQTYRYLKDFGTEQDDNRRLFWLGIIGILTILSRLDNVFLVAMVGVWLVFRRPSIRLLLMIDPLIIASSVFVSFLYKVGFEYKYEPFVDAASYMAVIALIINMGFFYFWGLYGRNKAGTLRSDLLRIILAVSSGTLVTSAIMLLISHLRLIGSFPRTVIISDWLLSLLTILIFRWIFAYSEKYTGLLPYFPGKGLLSDNWKRWFQLGCYFFGPTAVIMSIYMVVYKIYFNTFMPISSQVKHWWGSIVTVYGRPPISFPEFFGIPLVPDHGPWSLALGTIVNLSKDTLIYLGMNPKDNALFNNAYLTYTIIFGGIIILLLLAKWKKIIEITHNLPIWPLFAACMAQIINYSGTNYVNTRGWYWISEIILTILLLAILVEAVFSLLREQLKINSRILQALVVLLGMLMIVNYDSNLLQQIPPVIPAENETAYVDGIRELEQATEPGSIIGSTGGGVIGYFIKDRTVVNMDGLMNSAEYFKLMQDHKSNEYFDRIKLNYIYANSVIIDQSEPYIWMDRNRLEPVGNFGGSTLYRYLPKKP